MCRKKNFMVWLLNFKQVFLGHSSTTYRLQLLFVWFYFYVGALVASSVFLNHIFGNHEFPGLPLSGQMVHVLGPVSLSYPGATA